MMTLTLSPGAAAIAELEATHVGLAALIDRMATTRDIDELAGLIAASLDHTRLRFAREEELMAACGFVAIRQHALDHARILDELTRFAALAERGMSQMAAVFVAEHLPHRIGRHARTMDRAFAARLQTLQGPAKSCRKADRVGFPTRDADIKNASETARC